MTRVRTRALLALAISLGFAALFVRLGAWQLSRLRERRAFNATLSAHFAASPVDIASLPTDTAQGHYRRASASGALLYDRQVVYAGRAREGAPGADLLTPLAVAGRDTVVMIDRGWVPSADAATVDLTRWRERDSPGIAGIAGAENVATVASVAGFAETYAGTSTAPSAASAQQRVVRALDRKAIERLVGRPVAPYLIVQMSGGAEPSARGSSPASDSMPARGPSSPSDSLPIRRALPAMSEGPHASYAGQWFSFAVIALVGGVVLFRMRNAESGVRTNAG
jgi:surfeit locus 1 family protein